MAVRNPSSSSRVASLPYDRRGDIYELYVPSDREHSHSRLVTEKLKGAEKIIIWDPSFNVDDDSFYSNIHSKKVEVEILTICNEDQGVEDVNTFFDRVKNALADNDIEYKLTLRAFYNKPKDRYGFIKLWHDRYLIIEKENVVEVYLVGTSVNSHMGGKKAFGICELQSNDDKKIVLDAYEEYSKRVCERLTGTILEISDPEDF